jgi:hypothetical protein
MLQTGRQRERREKEAKKRRSGGSADLRKFAAPLLPGGQPEPAVEEQRVVSNPVSEVSMRTGNVAKYAVGQYVQHMGAANVSGHVTSLVADAAGATGPGTLSICPE